MTGEDGAAATLSAPRSAHPNTLILAGDCRRRLQELPAESVHCVVTSPPYWGLRSYDADTHEAGMIGMEDTFEDHLKNLIDVFGEVHRVLRSDGTLWLNYGDRYAANRTYQVPDSKHRDVGNTHGSMVPDGMKHKDLMMMPAQVAITLRSAGWWLRSEIIWSKRNAMPESVKDRPTNTHEKLYLLTKRQNYYYDDVAVRTDAAPNSHQHDDGATVNLRSVWDISTEHFAAAHFATFPPKLIQPCIKAGTSEHGVCAVCGDPWQRQISKKSVGRTRDRATGGLGQEHSRESHGLEKVSGEFQERIVIETVGWGPNCRCGTERARAVVLDPFGGAGTVAVAASRLGRDAVLCEISEQYASMSAERVMNDAGMFADVTVR